MEEKEKGGFSKQAEAAVYRSAQAGCPESLDQLLRQHEGLVRQIVAHQQLCGLPFEEALQVGGSGCGERLKATIHSGEHGSAPTPTLRLYAKCGKRSGGSVPGKGGRFRKSCWGCILI